MKPIRKVAVAAVAYAITYALRRLGVDLGTEAVNEAAQGLVTVGAAYLVRDPHVRAVEAEVEHAVAVAPGLADALAQHVAQATQPRR